MIITYLIINIIHTYIILYFLDIFYQRKRKLPLWCLGIVFIIYYLATSYIYFFIPGVTTNISVNIILCFLIGFLYDTSIFKHILSTAFINILSFACEYITASSLGLIFSTSITKAISENNLVIMGICFSNLLLFCLVKMLQGFIKHHNSYNNNLHASYWLALFFVPAGSLYIIYSLSLEVLSQQGYYLILLQSSVIILLGINILIFYLYDKLLKEESLKYENILLERQVDAYEKQAILTQRFQENIREKNHDINNHLAAILGLAEQNQMHDLLNYIKKLTYGESFESGINSGDLVVDAIVNSKLFIASQQNTSMETDIKLHDSLTINKVDLTIVLGNLLDNALEACTKLPTNQREIWLDIFSQYGVLNISIKNTYNTSDLYIKNGKLHTSKKEKEWHGIGLKNIDYAVKKYSGLFNYELSNVKEKQIFSTQIMLYLPKSHL